MAQGKQCIGRVYSTGSFHSSHCQKLARPGSDYCKQHDPEEVKKKRQLKEAKWKSEEDRKEALAALFPEQWRPWIRSNSLYNKGQLEVVFILPDGKIKELAEVLKGGHCAPY